MAYKIELSLKLKHTANISGITSNIINSAYKYYCYEHFVNYEYIHNKKAVIRNNCIINLSFDDNVKQIIKFIKFIKKNKNIYIENIGYEDDDNISFQILYASKTYLNLMQKSEAKEYIKKRKNGLLNDNPLFKEIYSR